MTNITVLHTSGRKQGSITKDLIDALVSNFKKQSDVSVKKRDANALPYVDEAMIESYFTEPAKRSIEQQRAVELSDSLVQELQETDILIIGAPIYNFSAPASLKAWADLVARVGVTFQFVDGIPVGQLKDKKAYIVVASGGTGVDSEIDWMTPWLRHFLGFIGIHDVETIAADGLMGVDAHEKLETAKQQAASSKLERKEA